MTRLETAYIVPDKLPEDIDGVIILGGALDTVLSRNRNVISLNDAAERVLEGIALAMQYPGASLIYAGGEGMLSPAGMPESEVFDMFLERYYEGQEGRRPQIIYEPRSRTTYENAVYAHDLVRPGKEQRWILVTSAYHMSRAVATFESNGWHNIIPYPVDYRAQDREGFAPELNARRGFEMLSLVWHEWLGILYYRMSGKIQAW